MEFYPCDTKGCENIATHSLVWTKEQRYCWSCFKRAMGVAQFMGFSTPEHTAKVISPLHLQIQRAMEAADEDQPDNQSQ